MPYAKGVHAKALFDANGNDTETDFTKCSNIKIQV